MRTDITARNGGRKILLVARNSGWQGTKARKQAIAEAHRVAEDLFRHVEIDVRDKIDDEATLLEALETRAVRKVSFDSKTKKRFVNEYLYTDLTPEVTLLISTGSGKKIDLDLTQPFLNEVNAQLRSGTYYMLAYHRVDRIFRTKFLCGQTLHYCEELEVTILDGELGVCDGDFAPIMTMWRAKESSDEASRIPKKTRAGQIAKTGTCMIGGSVPYAVAATPPAGLMRVRMLDANGRLGESRLFLDTPSNYPCVGSVAYGLPDVFIYDPEPGDGDLSPQELDDRRRRCPRADQVANVRFALTHLGRPGWTISAVARELIRRKFSTHRLRQENSPSTAFTEEQLNGEVHRVMRGIIDQLPFYESGKLTVRLGIAGFDDVTITDCFPDDGQWATAADFKRIRNFLATTRGGGPATQGLTGVMIETPGGPVPIRTAPRNRRAAGPSYVIRPAEAGVSSMISLPPLPHVALADSIVRALVAYADTLLIPLISTDLPQDAALADELRVATSRRDDATAECARLLERLRERDENGEHFVTGHLARELSRQYDELMETKVRPAQDDIRRIRAEIDAAAQRAAANASPAHAELLLRMVESLRDPFDTTYNDLWKKAITIERIDRTLVTLHRTSGTITKWRGTIRITGSGQEFEAPFHGELLDGAVAGLPRKVDHALEQLLVGVPFSDIKQTNARGVRLALAEHLGFDSGRFGLPLCDEPRLVRIATRLAVDTTRDPRRVALLLGEPVDLVRQVLVQLKSGRPAWGSIVLPDCVTDAA